MDGTHTHVAASGRKVGREEEKDGCQGDVHKRDLGIVSELNLTVPIILSYNVQDPAKPVGKDKGPLGKGVAST